MLACHVESFFLKHSQPKVLHRLHIVVAHTLYILYIYHTFQSIAALHETLGERRFYFIVVACVKI